MDRADGAGIVILRVLAQLIEELIRVVVAMADRLYIVVARGVVREVLLKIAECGPVSAQSVFDLVVEAKLELRRQCVGAEVVSVQLDHARRKTEVERSSVVGAHFHWTGPAAVADTQRRGAMRLRDRAVQ